MTDFRIWAVIIGLSVLTFLLRASFIVFLGHRKLPESTQRYLRYVSVATIPGMVAGLVTFPASMGGETNAVWLGASFTAIVAGIFFKNPLVIVLAGGLSFIALEILI